MLRSASAVLATGLLLSVLTAAGPPGAATAASSATAAHPATAVHPATAASPATTRSATPGQPARGHLVPSGIFTDPAATPAAAPRPGTGPAAGAPLRPSAGGSAGCSDRGVNVRVNQDCTNLSALPGRGQAQNEPAVAVNPRNPANLVAGHNDYRLGDTTCTASFSLDGGRRWGDALAPLRFSVPGFGGAARHYWDASGDPSVGFDSTGVAYLSCLALDRAAPANDRPSGATGLAVFRSLDGGASWSFPASLVKQSDGTRADGIAMLDKPYLAVDASPASPYRDRLYVAWIQFSTSFTTGQVFLAYSTDHGLTWRQSGDIAGSAVTLCPVNTSGAPAGRCDANHYPQPFLAPDGTVYVVFQNFNNAPAGPGANNAQVLLVRSRDGGATFDPPTKVADFYDLPDCASVTGQNTGFPCVPTAPASPASLFRATNYPVGVALDNRHLAVTLGSYINRDSNPARGNCVPDGVNPATGLPRYLGAGTPGGCSNDIVLATSEDAGTSFTGADRPVAELPTVSAELAGRPPADQFRQWAARTARGGLVVVYYDRRYRDDQRTGALDITLRHADGRYARITDRSLPPPNEFPIPGGTSGTFFGDYIGLAVGPDGIAHPQWADTRNPIAAPAPGDPRTAVPTGFGSDIYTARAPA